MAIKYVVGQNVTFDFLVGFWRRKVHSLPIKDANVNAVIFNFCTALEKALEDIGNQPRYKLQGSTDDGVPHIVVILNMRQWSKIEPKLESMVKEAKRLTLKQRRSKQ